MQLLGVSRLGPPAKKIDGVCSDDLGVSFSSRWLASSSGARGFGDVEGSGHFSSFSSCCGLLSVGLGTFVPQFEQKFA